MTLLAREPGIGGGGIIELSEGDVPNVQQLGAEDANGLLPLTAGIGGGAIGNGAEAVGARGGGGGMTNGDEESPWKDDVCAAGDVDACVTMIVCGLLPAVICSLLWTLFASRIFCTALARIAWICSRSAGAISAICSSLSDSSRTTFRMWASCASSTGDLPCEEARMTPTSARMH